MEKCKYFRLHNIERMKILEGMELASFKRRAVAFMILVFRHNLPMVKL